MQWNGSGASRVRRSSSASGRSTSTHLRLDDQGRTRQGRPTQSSWILRNPFHHVVIISQQTEPVHPAIQKFFPQLFLFRSPENLFLYSLFYTKI